MLGFFAFAALGFGVRRSVEPTMPGFSATQCGSRTEQQALVDGLARRVASALSAKGERAADASARPPVAPEVSPWRSVADWIRQYQAIAEAVATLRRRPSGGALADVQRALGEQPHACFVGGRREDEVIVGALEGALARSALSEDGVGALAAQGCAVVVAAAINRILDRDPRLASARRVAGRLAQLEQPADPQQRLQQLRALHDELSDEHSPLSITELSGPELGPDWGVSAFLRLRSELGEQAPRACLPESPARVQRLLAARFSQAIEATGLFNQEQRRWRASPETTRIASVLDAFFRLEFVQRRAPTRCRLSPNSASRWDREGLLRVALVLRDYSRGGQLDRLRLALRGRDSSRFPLLWSAIPEAACGKLTQNLCVELNDARTPLPKDLSELARARLQAASLELTRPIWSEIAVHARAFGCGATSFGLQESERSARELLVVANQAVADIHQSILERISASVEPQTSEPALSQERIEDELRRLRFELAALTFGLVEPALAQLELLGKVGPSSEPPSDAAAGGTALQRPSPQAWRALVDDLALPAALERGGASAAEGSSGVFAYEHLYAQLLSRLPQPCTVALSAWRDGVFDDSGDLFHGYGRHATAELLRACAVDETSARR